MGKLRIALISQPFYEISFPSPRDALGIWIYEVARRLANRCEVTVYTTGRAFKRTSTVHEGVCYQYLPILPERLLMKMLERNPFFHNFKRPLFSSQLYYRFYGVEVAQDLKRRQVEVVHILTFSQFIPIFRRFNPEIKIVFNMRDELLTNLDLNMIEKRLAQSTSIVGCSQYITDKVPAKFPQFSQRCQTIYNGIDENLFGTSPAHPSNRPVRELEWKPPGGGLPLQLPYASHRSKTKGIPHQLLFVGRVSPDKGVHILLEAFQIIVNDYPNVQLKIVGPTGLLPRDLIVAFSEDPVVARMAAKFYRFDLESYRSQLRHRSGLKRYWPKRDTFWRQYLARWRETASAADRVEFVGSVPHAKLVDFYQQADIFVLPSILNEAFGVPVAEAMAVGLPVVAARSGGIPEVVEVGKTGLLVERSNADALASAILSLLSNEILRQSLGQAGRKRALECFSLDRVAETFLRHYQNLCDRKESAIIQDL